MQPQPDKVRSRNKTEERDGDALNIIKLDPNAEFKLGGKDPPKNVNPLIYSGSAASYLDPRDNANYYAEDVYQRHSQHYQDFKDQAKSKES